jgi:hypothetical protein
VRALGAILQATLQGILQGAGPVGYFLSVKGYFTTGSSFLDSRFWAFLKRYLGVLILAFRHF